jgi:hypothetical protein
MSADMHRFDITPNGQQIHIAFGPNELKSSRHPCFKLGSMEDLNALRQKVWDHHVRAEASSPQEADQPGGEDSGKLLLPKPRAQIQRPGREEKKKKKNPWGAENE